MDAKENKAAELVHDAAAKKNPFHMYEIEIYSRAQHSNPFIFYAPSALRLLLLLFHFSAALGVLCL